MTKNEIRSLNSLEDIEFAVKRIDELEIENEKLYKALEIYVAKLRQIMYEGS